MYRSKYPRTWHLACSPGKHRDDRQHTDDTHLVGVPVVLTEKMDGSGVSLHHEGVFARSKVSTPTHPSYSPLKALHANLMWQLQDRKNLSLFGEWCHTIHAIQYPDLPPQNELLLFAVRNDAVSDGQPYDADRDGPHEWWPFDDVRNLANELGLQTAPVLWEGTFSTVKELTDTVVDLSSQPSNFGPDREGVVVRTAGGFTTGQFPTHISKWVREGHVAGERWERFGVRRHQTNNE